MYLRNIFIIALGSLLLACSATGPVRNFTGPARSNQDVAIVTVPAAITVRSIDGKPVDAPSKETGVYEVRLTPGLHIIAFRYELYWGDNDSGRLIKSHELGVDTTFEAGKNYALQYKAPHSFSEAEDLETDFSVKLVDLSSNQKYDSYEIENLNATVAAKLANKGKPATAPANQTVPAASATALSADAAVKEDPVKRLKFWWLMANPQQRKDFSDWMKTATENFAPSDTKVPDTAPSDTINGVKLKP